MSGDHESYLIFEDQVHNDRLAVVLTIENDVLRVAVLPHYGARVTSMVDKRSGRDWIYAGGQSSNTSEEANYSVDEAVGWDECFPTVSAYPAHHTPWRRRLRDHGDLWGRPWHVDAHDRSALTTSFGDPAFLFTRALRLEGSRLVADYRVENRLSEPLPYLWAQHNLLAVSPADRIVLDALGRVVATFLSHEGEVTPGPSEFSWPGPIAGLPFPLDAVQPQTAHLAAKLLVSGIPSRSVSVGHHGRWLTIAWDGLDDLGIWLTYGAWPKIGGVYHIALEPQSCFADHLGQAIERSAPPIAPHGSVAWRTTMTVGADLAGV